MERLVAVAAILASGLLGSCTNRAEEQYAYAMEYCESQRQVSQVAALNGDCMVIKDFQTIVLFNELYTLIEDDSAALSTCNVYAVHQPQLVGWRLSLRTPSNDIKASCDFLEGS